MKKHDKFWMDDMVEIDGDYAEVSQFNYISNHATIIVKIVFKLTN